MQYTIEARELTSEYTRCLSAPLLQTKIEASGPDDAISQYVRDTNYEVVSVDTPVRGQESIVTMKGNDALYLVRVYSD